MPIPSQTGSNRDAVLVPCNRRGMGHWRRSQMEVTELVQAVVTRQDALTAEMTALKDQVQQLLRSQGTAWI